jgi:undecaprenyl-diphosphatase
MTLIQSIVLSLIQGITEFLPISSSGHLNLAQYFFNLQPSLSLDIFLNTATFISVLFFFRKQLKYFFTNLKYIIVGSIPAGIIGVLFKDNIKSLFSNPKLLPLFFLITAALVFSTKFTKPKDKSLNYSIAIVIGFFQALAILPGVSRSGSTIFAGLLLGLSSIEAFNFSFCLFIPASLGALIMGIKDMSFTNTFTTEYLLAFIITCITGVVALNLLKKVLINHKFWLFGVYTFILAISLFFFL